MKFEPVIVSRSLLFVEVELMETLATLLSLTSSNVASIRRSGINGNLKMCLKHLFIPLYVASIRRSGINGNLGVISLSLHSIVLSSRRFYS